jgi:hypothetical protein
MVSSCTSPSVPGKQWPISRVIGWGGVQDDHVHIVRGVTTLHQAPPAEGPISQAKRRVAVPVQRIFSFIVTGLDAQAFIVLLSHLCVSLFKLHCVQPKQKKPKQAATRHSTLARSP